MYEGTLMIKMQLSEKYITNLENTIRELTDWYLITKAINDNKNEIYHNKKSMASLHFNLVSPACLR